MLSACTVATIVPTPLIEPRYFITPYVLFRLHLSLTSTAALWLETAFGLAVHAATTAYFLNRSWDGWDGVARIMW